MMSKLLKNVSLLILITLLLVTGCATNSNNNGAQNDFTKEKIDATLEASEEVFQITWSPDEEMVLYIQNGSEEKQGMDEAYYWRVGEEEAKFVRDVQPTTRGFAWSPDSKYFIISEKLGEGAKNSIVNVETMQEGTFKPQSMHIPVWSPDSTAIAYGNEFHEYGESWGFLEIYQIGEEENDYLWKTKNYLYKVESWDQEGNIHYTEIDDQGQESKKSTLNIRPSISGVHLGDTREQVIAALGKDYVETAPSGEAGHFPEQVYSLDYDGTKVFIGADSGKVLEIYTTSSQAETNLGIKMGDSGEKVFEAYRGKYIEPESIHGGTLYGIFKVEGAAALAFNFDTDPAQYPREIKPDNKVTGMTLTYPEIMDDSF
jgi:hypothetical protein